MGKRILNRREFLRDAGATAATVAVLAGTTTILATNSAWAMDLKSLSPHEAEVLLRMTRHLYPHDMLGDVYYAEVVEALDAKMGADEALTKLVKDGVIDLDKGNAIPWLRLSENYQLDAMRGMESSKFFQAVRGHTVVALYNNKNVWADFGYPGSSFQEGGYIFRGFQDAGWTLQPDDEASPPAYTG